MYGSAFSDQAGNGGPPDIAGGADNENGHGLVILDAMRSDCIRGQGLIGLLCAVATVD